MWISGKKKVKKNKKNEKTALDAPRHQAVLSSLHTVIVNMAEKDSADFG